MKPKMPKHRGPVRPPLRKPGAKLSPVIVRARRAHEGLGAFAFEVEVKILCDASEFNAGLDEIRAKCLALAEAAGPAVK